MKAVSDYKIDESFEQEFEITSELQRRFVLASGDDSLIHTDLEFCRKNGYDRLVGHAFLLTALLSGIYGTKFPGGNELCVSQTTNFRNPFFVGDTLRFKVQVTGMNISLQLLNLKVTVFNQDALKIFSGEGILKLSLRS